MKWVKDLWRAVRPGSHPGHFIQIFLSSSLLILAFPGPDIGILSLVALVPLIAALSRSSVRKAFFSGWGAGTLWFFISYNWVSNSLNNYGSIPLPLAELAIILLAAIHGFYLGLFSLLIPLVSGGSGKEVRGYGGKGVNDPVVSTPIPPYFVTPLLVLPSAWVLIEVARSWFPAPFPWLMMGTALWKVPFVRPLFETGGVFGVSFWIIMINVLIWMVFESGRGARIGAGAVLVVVFLIPLVLFTTSPRDGGGLQLRVGIVQGNVAQEHKWDESRKEDILRSYLSLTENAVAEGARLVVWPETAVPSYYQADLELVERMREFSRSRNVHLVFGSPGYEILGRDVLLYNRVYHLSPEGDEEYYDKTMLVPFGEYVPFARFMPFIDKLVPGEGEFARGVWEGPFKTPVNSGALVCYEIAFPSLVRREVDDGSVMLINVTNDAWFGRSWGPYQHLAMAVVRARENRVPVLRAANTGISAIIDRNGRIVRNIPLGKRGVIVADVKMGDAQTLYTRYGDWIVNLSLAVLSVYFLVLLNAWRSRRWTA